MLHASTKRFDSSRSIKQKNRSMPSPSKILAVIFASLACYFRGNLGPYSIQAQTLSRGPANPGPIVWDEPDGTQITVRLLGDEHGHFAEHLMAIQSYVRRMVVPGCTRKERQINHSTRTAVKLPFRNENSRTIYCTGLVC